VIGGKKPYWVVNKRITWFFILSHLLGGWLLAWLQTLWLVMLIKRSHKMVTKEIQRRH
jgi:hypothetical protein